MIGAAGLSPEDVVAQITAAVDAASPGGRIGVNFLVPFLDARALDASLSAAAVVECFYGDPDSVIVDRVHRAGALMAWQVGSVEEAASAERAGCDFVVAQGREAGGHVRGSQPLSSLLQGVRTAVDIPVVAAGGIGSGHAFAAALLAGADAVRIGTRLVATVEADTHPDYAAALVASTAADTVLTDTFSMGWPRAPHRVLRACVEASTQDPIERSPLPPTRDFVGPVASAALYAGESVTEVTRVQPAEDVISELVRDAVAALDAAPMDKT
jgi:NAD(P)H-dependent flavin oxidoreductase YrpB (nitropropane dioxygenase family)